MKNSRSKVRNAQATRECLLEAAERIFVEKGPHAARVDEIAATARVNKRMIYHYFGSKEGLYLEVLRRNFARAFAMGRGALQNAEGPYERAVEFICRYFYFLAENPGFVRLVGWEVLNNGRYACRVLPDFYTAGLCGLEAVLQEGIREGVFRADCDLRQLVISIGGLCHAYFSRAALVEALWHRKVTAPEMLESTLNHLLQLVFEGVLRR